MKKRSLIFILACMAVCLTPLLGMLFRPTTVSTENRALADFPSLIETDGGLNLDFLPGVERCFNDRFAFKNELVYADSRLLGELFGVSGVDRVIYGTDGWLYYASTLDDYLGLDRMSGRELFNTAHNLALVSRYVQARGGDFLLTIPPNKNTLYGEHMPAYAAYVVDPTHDADRLAPLLRELGVPYADLFTLFRNEEESVYLKRDSHWNERGALLAYNCMLDSLGYPHDDYAGVPVRRVVDEDGDLNRMLYTFYGKKSANYHYDIPQSYRFSGTGADVEDAWLVTEGAGSASLLMFRDSFGNTLIPLLANQFETAWFTRETPYGLEPLMDRLSPTVVIFEKVERNLAEFITLPPILSAPEAALAQPETTLDTPLPVTVEPLEYDSGYVCVGGEIPEELLGDRTEIFVRIGGRTYEAFHIGENGFLIYLKNHLRLEGTDDITILLRDGEGVRALRTGGVE